MIKSNFNENEIDSIIISDNNNFFVFFLSSPELQKASCIIITHRDIDYSIPLECIVV